MFAPRIMLAAMTLGALLTAIDAPLAAARTSGVLARARMASLETTKLSEDGAKEACCPEPCITYRHCGPRLCCDCKPPVETVIKVKDPCTCCEIDIPVCMPACCEGEPTVCWTTGAFCRDVAIYEWCCGFKVRVTFKHCGDLIVTTWGR